MAYGLTNPPIELIRALTEVSIENEGWIGFSDDGKTEGFRYTPLSAVSGPASREDTVTLMRELIDGLRDNSPTAEKMMILLGVNILNRYNPEDWAPRLHPKPSFHLTEVPVPSILPRGGRDLPPEELARWEWARTIGIPWQDELEPWMGWSGEDGPDCRALHRKWIYTSQRDKAVVPPEGEPPFEPYEADSELDLVITWFILADPQAVQKTTQHDCDRRLTHLLCHVLAEKALRPNASDLGQLSGVGIAEKTDLILQMCAAGRQSGWTDSAGTPFGTGVIRLVRDFTAQLPLPSEASIPKEADEIQREAQYSRDVIQSGGEAARLNRSSRYSPAELNALLVLGSGTALLAEAGDLAAIETLCILIRHQTLLTERFLCQALHSIARLSNDDQQHVLNTLAPDLLPATKFLLRKLATGGISTSPATAELLYASAYFPSLDHLTLAVFAQWICRAHEKPLDDMTNQKLVAHLSPVMGRVGSDYMRLYASQLIDGYIADMEAADDVRQTTTTGVSPSHTGTPLSVATPDPLAVPVSSLFQSPPQESRDDLVLSPPSVARRQSSLPFETIAPALANASPEMRDAWRNPLRPLMRRELLRGGVQPELLKLFAALATPSDVEQRSSPQANAGSSSPEISSVKTPISIKR